MKNAVMGALGFLAVTGLLASGSISKLRDHIRSGVANMPTATDPFSTSTNPAKPAPVGEGGDFAAGPNFNGGPFTVSGTTHDNSFTMDGTINYFSGGKLQQASIPQLKGKTFAFDNSDPAAPIRIPLGVIDQVAIVLNEPGLMTAAVAQYK